MGQSICPNCKASVAAGDEICDMCGLVLISANPVADTPRDATSSFMATSNGACPHCHSPIHAGDEICDNCGLDLQAISTTTATITAASQPDRPRDGERCPRCGTLRASDKKFCNRCGFSFATLSSATGIQPALQPDQLTSGSLLGGKYKIKKKIAEGGMGAVYLAQDQLLKRDVVIKTLLRNDDPDLIAQSVQEREFLANMKQANIVSIYDFVSESNRSYIVMEHVNGETLDEIMETRKRPFSVPEAIRYILGILPAFIYLAKLDPPLVYCDFKPDNVMREVLRDGTMIVKLIDLGTVVKFHANPDPKQPIYGTRGYFARQAVTRPSPQTDLYSICRVLAHLVTRMDVLSPMFGMPPAEQYSAFREHPALYRLLVKGTHDDPAQRFQSAEELTEQLTGVLRLVEGGTPGVSVTSNLFVAESTTTTGKMGLRCEAALDASDRALNPLRNGDSALRGGNYEAAITFYKQARNANRLSLDAPLRLAEVYIEQGKFDLACDTLNIAQKITPGHWKLAWYTGRLYEAQGNLKEAATHYQHVIDQLPGELPPRQALARVRANMSDDNGAVNLYSEVLKADPNNTGAILGVTLSLRKLKRYAEAIKILANVSEAAARYNEAQFQLCDIYLKDIQPLTADNIQFASEAIQALAGRTDEPRFYRARADIYYAAWEMLRQSNLPKPTKIAGISSVNLHSLGSAAESNYIEYLKRNPRPADREAIIRRKFQAAPWRWF